MKIRFEEDFFDSLKEKLKYIAQDNPKAIRSFIAKITVVEGRGWNAHKRDVRICPSVWSEVL